MAIIEHKSVLIVTAGPNGSGKTTITTKMLHHRLLVVFMFLYSTALFAQDVIVKKDGSTVLSKVIEIGVSEIKYKKFSNQNGPTYSVLKTDVLSINFENGERESFADMPQSAKQEAEARQQVIEAQPAADNAEIISRYNRTYEHGKAISDIAKPAKQAYCIMGVGENSVLSTDDITIEFCQEPWHGCDYDRDEIRLSKKFFVQICNKTDKVIYLDLGNTFRVMKDGSSKAYYDNSQTTINQGSGSGTSVNLGAIAGAVGVGGALGTLASGVNVGSGNSNSISKVYTKQRIVAIPPHGKIPLEKYQREWIKNNSEVISEGENLDVNIKEEDFPIINRGSKYFYKENDSPWHADYIVTYSKDAEFTTTSYVVKASVYMREFIGCSKLFFYDYKTKKLYEKMKDRIPEYNDYCIVGESRIAE